MCNQKYLLALLVLNIAIATHIKAAEAMTPSQKIVYERIMVAFHNLQVITDAGAGKAELDRQASIVIDDMNKAKSQFSPKTQKYIDAHIGALRLGQKANYPTSQEKLNAQKKGIILFAE